MPQLKQPVRLEEACIRLHINKYCGKCRQWMQASTGRVKRDQDAYTVVFDTVIEECRQMEEEISNLSPGILKLLSPRLAKKFAKLICTHHCNFLCFFGPRGHFSLCKAMFRSVLNRFIEKFDIRFQTTDIMLENLDSVPGLLQLRLHPCHCDEAVILKGMQHLKNLQIFKFLSDCTDEIIEELQRHCPHLTVLDIEASILVTNASVQPLRKARKLQFLNLYETSIDDEHYGLLLSELPSIGNVISDQDVGSLLRHIAVERLDTITHVKIWALGICRITRDVSCLRVFNALRVLEFHRLDCVSSNFNTVLQGLGHRLTDLKLDDCNVHLQDIIILCPSLVNLSLTSCSTLHLNSSIPFDFQLPHFRNLINLEIGYALRNPDDINYIRYYNSLKTIHLMYTRSFTVGLVGEILNLGTYKQLEVLRIEEDSRDVVNVEALQLLMRHCPLLKRIEISGDQDVFGELKRQILFENFDLKFKKYVKTYPRPEYVTM
jgi:hypothetical protein